LPVAVAVLVVIELAQEPQVVAQALKQRLLCQPRQTTPLPLALVELAA
jgi:hypothetical protein